MIEPLTPAETENLDPGIRDLVVALRAAGYETTDSGDGVSKSADWYESGEAIPYPHVVVDIPEPEKLWFFTNALYEWLYANGYQKFTVEASYVPEEKAVAMVRPRHSQMPIEQLRELCKPTAEPTTADLVNYLRGLADGPPVPVGGDIRTVLQQCADRLEVLTRP